MGNLRDSAEPKIVKYLNFKAAKERIPLNITFELTSRCNFACSMCYIHNADCQKNAREELTAAQWISIARSAKEAGTVFVLITGGEPLIRKDFAEIYEAIAQMGFIISLNTNLSLLSDETLGLFTRFPPHRVNVSLYGTGDELYSSFCGVPAFTKIKENILKMRERSIPVKINSSITRLNVNDLENMMEFCDEHGVAFKATGYMFPSARLGTHPERLGPRETAAVKAAIDRHFLCEEDFAERTRRINAGVAAGDDNDCPVEDSEYGRIRCRAGSSSAWIDWRGNMSFCGMIPAREGNNVIGRSFEECWKSVSEEARNVRMPEKCAGCSYRHICILCAASQYCETGGYDEPPEFICAIAKSIPGEYNKYSTAK
ncbi:MAG: radical SAM protein [Clostridia bacterium]|nr:radical SAM protein [Clostridia bacterium]MBR6702373.1 radical SAM protein [Clostridia bacterium]